MLLAFTIFTTFATPTQVGVQEVNIAMNADTNSLLQVPLLMDGFQKLDLNHDGFLNKTERKPLMFGVYSSAAERLSEGNHVTREFFVQNAVVPDFANQEGNDVLCSREDAVIATDPEDLWFALAGEEAWMTVTDFADALYDLSEDDHDLDYAGFQQFAVSHTVSDDYHANDRFTLVKLSDYTESHNVQCQANAVARRALVVPYAVGVVAKALGLALLGATFECVIQHFMLQWAGKNGFGHQLYDKGCTWTQNFVVALGAEVFGGAGMWAFGRVSSFFGWGPAVRGVNRMVATHGVEHVEAELVGRGLARPLLQEAGTQTLEDVVVHEAEQVAEAVVETFIPEVVPPTVPSMPSNPFTWRPPVIGI